MRLFRKILLLIGCLDASAFQIGALDLRNQVNNVVRPNRASHLDPCKLFRTSPTTSTFHLDADRRRINRNISYTKLQQEPLQSDYDRALSISHSDELVLDTAAIFKYILAIFLEMTLFGITFYSIDYSLIRFNLNSNAISSPILWFMFYAFSLKSRVFNPLNNSRPKVVSTVDGTSSPGFRDRIMPKWTPPGFVFPIVWLLLIGPLRATSSVLVVKSSSKLLSKPIMSLMLHLSIGDVWNTINNTERRYGTSVLGVIAVWLSAFYASRQYFGVSVLAGKLLGVTCIWLTIAATLIVQTWRLNSKEFSSDSEGVKLSPRFSFLPTRIQGQPTITKFMWKEQFSKK